MKHTNDVNNIEEGQNVNTLSEIEEYYKAREQQLLKKLHRQEAALAAAEQTLKRLTENQKAPMDETTEQRTAQEQAFKEKLYRDPLTGIYNRRYYDERLKNLEGWFSFAMIDMDNFKHINDRFGHQAGDAALYRAAQAIKSQIRSDDELVRYGAMNSSCCSATCRSRSWRRNCSPSAPRLTRSSSRSILNRTSARASAARSRRDAS